MGRHTKQSHAEYLASDHWQDLRKRYLSEQPWCERCEMPRWLAPIAYGQDLHVHHKNYRNYGEETWEDLEALCRRCHEIETHGRSSLIAPNASTCIECGRTHWDPRAEVCDTCERVVCSDWLLKVSDRVGQIIENDLKRIKNQKAAVNG